MFLCCSYCYFDNIHVVAAAAAISYDTEILSAPLLARWIIYCNSLCCCYVLYVVLACSSVDMSLVQSLSSGLGPLNNFEGKVGCSELKKGNLS